MQYNSSSGSPSRVVSTLSACIAAPTQQVLFFAPIHLVYLFLVVVFELRALHLKCVSDQA